MSLLWRLPDSRAPCSFVLRSHLRPAQRLVEELISTHFLNDARQNYTIITPRNEKDLLLCQLQQMPDRKISKYTWIDMEESKSQSCCHRSISVDEVRNSTIFNRKISKGVSMILQRKYEVCQVNFSSVVCWWEALDSSNMQYRCFLSNLTNWRWAWGQRHQYIHGVTWIMVNQWRHLKRFSRWALTSSFFSTATSLLTLSVKWSCSREWSRPFFDAVSKSTDGVMKIHIENLCTKSWRRLTFAVDAVDVVSALNVKTNLLSASKNSLTTSKKVAVGTNVKTP